MSQVLISPSPQPSKWQRISPHIRLPISLLGLTLILYFTVYSVWLVPSVGYQAHWRPDNVLRIQAVYAESPVANVLQAGDVILAIDGRPALWHVWSPVYPIAQDGMYEHTIQRGEETFVVELALDGYSPPVIIGRLMTGLVAFLAGIVGVLTILFATVQNYDAWRLGLTTIFVAVVLAASEAAIQGVPGGWLFYNPLAPLAAVSWMHVAFLPRDKAAAFSETTLFRPFYALAALLSLLLLYELFVLVPTQNSFQKLTGISSYDVVLLLLVVGQVGHIFVLGWRFWQTPISYQRQQLGIILGFTAVASLPIALFTMLPRLLSGTPLLPWEFTITLLVLLPAGYAYVIYRRSYLGLDIFISRGLTLLVVSLLAMVFFALALYFLQRLSLEVLTGSFIGPVLLFPMLLTVPYANRRVRPFIDTMLYGADRQYPKHLADITAMLSANPQVETLQAVIDVVSRRLQVRRMVLFLQQDEQFLPKAWAGEVQLSPVLALACCDRLFQHNQPLVMVQPSMIPTLPWVDYAVPLYTSARTVGLLLLERPMPDSYLNAVQVDFLRQLTSVMAMAIEAIHLFDASRKMSRSLLEVRHNERVMIAAQVHDGPLQRVSLMAGEMAQLSRWEGIDAALSREIAARSRDLSETSRVLRQICEGLYPPVLEQGPKWALEEVVDEFSQQTNIAVALEIDLSDEAVVPISVIRTLYYVLTEALNNIHKHAQATAVWVSLAYDRHNRQLELLVEDDGQRTSIGQLSFSDLIRAHHFGIAGMHELASLVGGTLKLSTQPEEGTQLLLQIPCHLQLG